MTQSLPVISHLQLNNMLCNPQAWHQPPDQRLVYQPGLLTSRRIASHSFAQLRTATHRSAPGEPMDDSRVLVHEAICQLIPRSNTDRDSIRHCTSRPLSFHRPCPRLVAMAIAPLPTGSDVNVSRELCQESTVQTSTQKSRSHGQKAFEAYLRGGRRGFVLEWPTYLHAFF